MHIFAKRMKYNLTNELESIFIMVMSLSGSSIGAKTNFSSSLAKRNLSGDPEQVDWK